MAVIMLLFHHLFYHKDVFEKYNLVFNGGTEEWKLLNSLAVFGKICVAIFVFVSAYGLTKQYIAKNVLTNKRKLALDSFSRYTKLTINLWVIYLPFLILSFILQKHTWWDVYGTDGNWVSAVKNCIIDLLGLSKLFGTPSFNSTWWYISLAVLIIITVPVLNLLYLKIEWLLVGLAFFFVLMISADNGLATYYLRYLLGIVIAVVMANNNTIEKTKAHIYGSPGKLLIFAVLGLIILFISYYLRSRAFISYSLLDNIAAIAIVYIVFVCNQIPILGLCFKGFEFIGYYSMNIFLMHTFICSTFFRNFIFSFRYWWLILIVLLCISLLLSFLIEKIKNVAKIDLLQQNLDRFIRCK